MSLDVTLFDEVPAHFADVFDFNITHNLCEMADAAGIYKAMWRPEEIPVTTAGQLIPLLEAGIEKLMADPAKFEAMNPENGWGDYAGLLRVARRYLAACKDHPNATIQVSR